MKKPAYLLLAASGIALAAGVVVAGLVSRTSHAAPPTAPEKQASSPAALLTSTDTDSVVEAANAFLATLSEKQRATVQPELTARNAARWSNLPITFVPRNGLYFRDLNAAQTAAALKVARLALGKEGFTRFGELRAADELLAKVDTGIGGGPPLGNFSAPPPTGPGGFGGPGGPLPGVGGQFGRPRKLEYGAGDYSIAFLGKPSKTVPFLLQLGGHHLAFNLYYKGASGTATPYFLGVEPTSWKDNSGKTHAPLAPMRDAMYGLVHSLTPPQQTQARLTARFADVYVGPGRDNQFPAREGVAVSSLSAASQNFVKKAITAWTGDNAQAAVYRKQYFAELDQTKIAYSGSVDLSNHGDYVRIDGPHVWIEFACQNGIVYHNQIHYHTIWRDRTSDYGAEFSF